MRRIYTFILGLSISSLAFASPAAVTLKQCHTLKGTGKPFILIVKRGQELMHAITQCAVQAKLMSASISGIGALQNPTIAYYNLKKSRYDQRRFKGIFELVSLLGNVTVNKGKLFTHAHVALGTHRFHIFGGHLMKSKVGVTAEVTFIPLPGAAYRHYNQAVKLNTILGYKRTKRTFSTAFV